MIPLPPPTIVLGHIKRILAVYFNCDVCPNPHRLALCSVHARRVLEVAQPFYGLADEGEECQLCLFAQSLLQRKDPRLFRCLNDTKKLLNFKLNMGLRRVA